MASAALLAAAAPCLAAPPIDLRPRFKEPPAGETVDRTFVVELPPAVERPCIAIQSPIARIEIPRATLEGLAKAGPPGSRWKSEGERLAMIRGDRARGLLSLVAPPASGGCGLVADDAVPFDEQYLLAELLKAGHAAVIDPRNGRAAARLRVHYKAAGGVGGWINFHADRGLHFLSVQWWVS